MSPTGSEVLNLGLTIDSKSLAKLDSAAENFGFEIGQAVRELDKVGLHKKGKDFHAQMMKISAEQTKLSKELIRNELEMKKKNLDDERRKELANLHQLHSARLTALKNEAKVNSANQKESVRKTAEAQKAMGWSGKGGRLGKAAKVSEKLSEGAGDIFKDATSKDVGGIASIFKKLGSGAKTAGAATAEQGGMMGMLGKGLAGAAPILAAIGAIAAAFAVVAKVIMDADAQSKEFNRTLIDAGMAAGDLQSEFKGVTESLDTVREAFTGWNFNRMWGTTAKDHLAILAAYGEAGLTFREITAGAKDSAGEIDKLQKATAHALTYSKLLGMSTAEVSTNTANYMEELGYTLEGVAGHFSAIAVMAKESGFSTKRFFGMLIQATSGMSMYNVRLEEAGALLTSLGKILGQKKAGDTLGELTKGFKDEGTQDRIKKTMTTGVGFTLKVLQQGAEKTAADFQEKLTSFGKDSPDAAAGIRGLLSEAGIEVGGKGGSPEEMAKKFATLSGQKQGEILAKAGSFKGEGVDAMVRMLGATMNKSVAFKGGRAGAQAARQFADPAEVLVLQLNEVRGIIGKSLDQIDLTDEKSRMAWENITGKSGEAALALWSVGKLYRGQETTIKENQELLKKTKDAGEKELIVQKFNAQYQEKWRVRMDRTGKIFNDAGKEISGTADSLLQNFGVGEAGKANIPEDIRLAKEVASNTTDMSKILEQGVQYFLQRIDSGVSYIADLMGMREKGLTGPALEAKAAAIKELREKQSAGDMAIAKQESLIARKQKELSAPGLSDAEKENLKAEISGMQRGVKRARLGQKVGEAQIRGLVGMTTEEGLKVTTKEGFLGKSKSGGAAHAAMAETLTPTQMKQIGEIASAAGVAASKKVSGEGEAAAEKASITAQEQIWQQFAAELGFATAGTEEIRGGAQFEKVLLEGSKGQGGKTTEQLLSTQTNAQKKMDEVLQSKDWKHADDVTAKKIAEEFIEAGKRAELTKELMQGGMKEGAASAAAGGLRSHGIIAGGIPASIFSALTGNAGGVPGVPGVPGGTPNDLLLQIGAGGKMKFAQRIDPGDVGVFSKPSGALSQAGRGGGGGGTMNVYHMYNDGPGVLQSITKAQQAGVLK